ncbi:hypothetical protein TVAG_394480 [Trichomonas vaginalis G3]|uniref:Uncharacterized protein n=1 Tax=Trichomonas vaginalis (strain ATCC PRA-98 / G3) TaxID=412133 RepID=A2DWG4_TRIV3|nr:hypothetical protein TVAGG3_0428670 [Trichomonas vaginalis G3]EAY15304.1 hypothetical protein TVAG_394480 [Trichomonas vaginalis G3]KAI5536602.1 hypothetical protein TVAGG3_0428670 [Trichomonas vaginalis G3]|eukprot:XP_001327527.1 hypothetical protein [Trichomonas vaginalis G3]
MNLARKLNWLDYFEEQDRVNQTKDGVAFSNTTGTKSYYVFICIFYECKENGAIYIRRTNEICTLLEDNIFTKCKSTSDGGSVYYYGYKGQFVQQRNCYSESIATNYYMSFYQQVKSSSTNKNHAFQISVSKCGESESEGSETFNIAWGDLRFENNNITYNKCWEYSSISFVLDGKSGYCNYSTFRENNQTGSYSLVFNSRSPSLIQTVSYCNVIGNKCGTDSNQVLFSCQYNTNVDHCVFLNNTAAYMFWIYWEGYTLTITDSYVQSKSKTSTGGIVTFKNENSNSDLNEFPNFYTINCFIESKQITVLLPYLSRFAEKSSNFIS